MKRNKISLTFFKASKLKFNQKTVFALFVFLLILTSCNKKGISVSEYKAWFSKKDCPLIKNQESDGFQYELHYLTSDFMALSEIPDKELNSGKLKDELKARNGLYYFLLRITPTKEKQQQFTEEESKSINWLSFGAKEDMLVIAGKDTLRCMMMQFEPSMGIMPYQSFNIGINKPNEGTDNIPQTNLEFIFIDKVNSGKQLKFSYKANDFKQIPTYKL
ncbi:MAG: hypothetical protein NTZ33_14595 [Bacteroidetes bacterium]|nr:hypothetical protein [Bacteroidota bacterium]